MLRHGHRMSKVRPIILIAGCYPYREALVKKSVAGFKPPRISSELGADFYFTHPYASWERG